MWGFETNCYGIGQIQKDPVRLLLCRVSRWIADVEKDAIIAFTVKWSSVTTCFDAILLADFQFIDKIMHHIFVNVITNYIFTTYCKSVAFHHFFVKCIDTDGA